MNKKDEAQKLLKKGRGQFIMGQALYLGLKCLKSVENEA